MNTMSDTKDYMKQFFTPIRIYFQRFFYFMKKNLCLRLETNNESFRVGEICK